MIAAVCPQCDKPGGALTAVPHCKHESCIWNTCHCGAIYSRQTAQGFVNSSKAPKFFPATT